MNKSKASKLLSILEEGISVEINSITYVLSDDRDLCVVGHRANFRTGIEEECLIRYDCGIKGFFALADKISDEEYIRMTASAVLTRMNTRRISHGSAD